MSPRQALCLLEPVLVRAGFESIQDPSLMRAYVNYALDGEHLSMRETPTETIVTCYSSVTIQIYLK